MANILNCLQLVYQEDSKSGFEDGIFLLDTSAHHGALDNFIAGSCTGIIGLLFCTSSSPGHSDGRKAAAATGLQGKRALSVYGG